MGLSRFLNSIKVYDDTVTAGDGEQSSSVLPALVTQSRPNDLFRYVYGVLFTFTFTPTYGGQAAAALEAINMWQFLSKVYLKIKGIDAPLIRDISSLDIVRSGQQAMRAIHPDVLSNYLPVSDLAAAQSGVEQTVYLFLPIAPRFTKRTSEPGKYLGLLPLSSFAEADLKFAPLASSTLQADWTTGDVAIKAHLLCDDLKAAVPVVPVFWRAQNVTGSDVLAPKGSNDCRILSLIATATTDAALTPPTTYSANIGSKVVLPNRNAADQIRELTLFRNETYNDSPYTAIQPIFDSDGLDLDECPIADGEVSLNGVFSNNSDAGRLIMVYAEQLPEATQIQIQVGHKVPIDVATAAAQRITAATTAENRALVETTFARAAG